MQSMASLPYVFIALISYLSKIWGYLVSSHFHFVKVLKNLKSSENKVDKKSTKKEFCD